MIQDHATTQIVEKEVANLEKQGCTVRRTTQPQDPQAKMITAWSGKQMVFGAWQRATNDWYMQCNY